jgi:hypothetical protein
MVVRFLQAEGASLSEIHCSLVTVYGQDVFRQMEVSVWCNKFKGGQSQRNRGRPRISHTDKNGVVKGLIRKIEESELIKLLK